MQCATLAGVLDLALGTSHTVLVNQDGSMWGTGRNTNGQLGIGLTMPLSKRFVQVISRGVTATAVGFSHSIVLKQDGSVWATGSNSKGQLGVSSTTIRDLVLRQIRKERNTPGVRI